MNNESHVTLELDYQEITGLELGLKHLEQTPEVRNLIKKVHNTYDTIRFNSFIPYKLEVGPDEMKLIERAKHTIVYTEWTK